MARRKTTPSADEATPIAPARQEQEAVAEEAAPKKRGRPKKKKEPEIVLEILPEDVVEVSSVAVPLTEAEVPTPETVAENAPQEEAPAEAVAADSEKKKSKKAKNGSENSEQKGSNLPVQRAGGALAKASPITISAPAAQERKNFWKTIIAIVILSAVVVAAIWIFTSRAAPFGERHDAVSFFYVAEKNATAIAYNGSHRYEASGDLTYSTRSGDGKTYAAIIGGSLYLVRGNNVDKLADGVQDCVLSLNGEALAWRVGEKLYYDLLGDKAEPSMISTTAADPRYTLSPDGNELFYVYTKDGKPHAQFESRSGTAPYIANNLELFPVAVTDRCKQVYYTDKAGVLYVLSAGSEKAVVCGEQVDMTSLIFNRSNSQLILLDNGKTRIFENGAEIRIPKLEGGTLQYLPNQRVADRALSVGTQYVTDSFFYNYYLHKVGESERLIYLKREEDQATINPLLHPNADSADKIAVTDTAVYYLVTSTEGATTHTNLFHCANGSTDSKRLEFDVSNFRPNKEGNRLLYTSEQGALFSMKIGSPANRLLDHVEVASLTVNSEDVFYFYREPGVLYLSDNGGAPRLVSEGVADFTVDGQTLYYRTSVDEGGAGNVYAIYQSRKQAAKIADRVTKMK